MADSGWRAVTQQPKSTGSRGGGSATLGGVTMLASAPFAHAVEQLRAVRPRPEIEVSEITAPQQLAPYSFALAADVEGANGETASGRLILLFNPAGEPAWRGTMRLASYITAEAPGNVTAGEDFAQTCWEWHIESLQAHRAEHSMLAGAVTQATSTRFGASNEPLRQTTDIELRASWTPANTELEPHAEAWFDLLAASAQLPPPGITVLQPRR